MNSFGSSSKLNEKTCIFLQDLQNVISVSRKQNELLYEQMFEHSKITFRGLADNLIKPHLASNKYGKNATNQYYKHLFSIFNNIYFLLLKFTIS